MLGVTRNRSDRDSALPYAAREPLWVGGILVDVTGLEPVNTPKVCLKTVLLPVMMDNGGVASPAGSNS